MTSIIASSRKSSLFVIPAQIIIRILGMVATIILARNLTVASYGVYNLFLGAVLFFNFFTNMGLASSLQRFLSEYARLAKNGSYLRTFFFSIEYRTVTSVIVFALAVLFYNKFSSLFKVSEYKLGFILFCLGTFALFQTDYLELAFNTLFLHKYSSLGGLIGQTLRVVLIAVTLMVFAGGVTEVFASELVAYGIAAIFLWFFFNRQIYQPRKESFKEDKEPIEWKRILRFTAYNAATIPGGFFFSYALDYFVVASMASTNQLGIYALASHASDMLMSTLPTSVLDTVVRPAFFHNYSSAVEKNRELDQMFRSFTILIGAVLFPILVLIGIHAEPILTFVFKSKYAGSTPIFLIFLAFNIFAILETPSDLVLQAIEKVEVRLYAQVFAVYNLVADIFLLSKFGLLGVAFATGSAYMAKSLFWYFMARHYTGISISWAALLKIAINTALAGAVAFGVGLFGHSLLWVFASLASGFLVYITLLFVNPFFNDREKDIMNRFLKLRVFNV